MSDYSELPWFLKEYIHENRWDSFRDIQTRTFEAIRENGNHIIISSPTSSGKTEAAFFPVIASLYDSPPESVGAIYIGPLKALIDDQFERIRPMIEKSEITVTGWHGDISASVKKKILREPKGILQITPESLQNIIVNERESLVKLFSGLRFVIIDEIHVFVPSPRGAQTLCCLETIERICGCRPRRIGLSATLGSMDTPRSWLSANTGRDVTVITDDSKRESRISIQYNRFPAATDEDPLTRKKYLTDYYRRLFEEVDGKDCLIFTNSRVTSEKTARSLSIVAEKYGRSNMVSVHHGSISKEFRKDAEERMKDPYRKHVTVATSSLELGIDVGSMEKIIQIDPPISCSSLLQRMGRSGRRGGVQDMTIICNDDDQKPWQDMFGISTNLIKSIAMAELAMEGWTEPLEEDPFPFGLLFHQTLEYMACTTGCRFSELKENVLSMYPFRNISEDQYKILLRYLIATKILERMEDGTLLIGSSGERLAFGYDFCSVFDSRPEIAVFIDGRQLGSIPELPEVGDNIQLAGRMWKVIASSKETLRVDVKPSEEGSCSPWESDVPLTDDRIMMKMYEVLSSKNEYDYLDDDAKERLDKSRRAFSNCGMDSHLAVTEWGMRVSPWLGSKAFDTIRRALITRKAGAVSAHMPYYIDVYTRSAGYVEKIYSEFRERGGNKDLIDPDEDICFGKFDKYIPRELLTTAFVWNRLAAKR